MKQLQWDKLPHQQVAKTLWNDEKPQKEQEMIKKLQSDGVWRKMEEDFKAKQLVINLMGMLLGCQTNNNNNNNILLSARQKRAELKSVLDPQTKKRVGMWLLLLGLVS